MKKKKKNSFQIRIDRTFFFSSFPYKFTSLQSNSALFFVSYNVSTWDVLRNKGTETNMGWKKTKIILVLDDEKKKIE